MRIVARVASLQHAAELVDISQARRYVGRYGEIWADRLVDIAQARIGGGI